MLLDLLTSLHVWWVLNWLNTAFLGGRQQISSVCKHNTLGSSLCIRQMHWPTFPDEPWHISLAHNPALATWSFSPHCCLYWLRILGQSGSAKNKLFAETQIKCVLLEPALSFYYIYSHAVSRHLAPCLSSSEGNLNHLHISTLHLGFPLF